MVDRATSLLPDWLDVSRETFEALLHFADMVEQWTARINLISPATVPDLWNRHVLDSAQLFEYAGSGTIWGDFGSGAGFPGLVLAILAKEKRPDLRFHLVESDQRKSAFLRKAVMDLSLPAQIHAQRAEKLSPLAAQIISARALASLSELFPLLAPHLAAGGQAIFPKGAKAMEEVDLARKTWHFDLSTAPSHTDPRAQILMIENLRHV
jgi:16S rRNA (guanine527-N7)-methyltransferase